MASTPVPVPVPTFDFWYKHPYFFLEKNWG